MCICTHICTNVHIFIYLLYLLFANNAIMRAFTLSVCSRPVNNRAKADEALI